jgi:hypothetical protein
VRKSSTVAAGCLAFPRDRVDPLLHGIDPGSQVRDLVQQLATDFPGERRQIRAFVLRDSTEAQEIADLLGRDEAKLVKVRLQCVDRFSALLHELLAGAEQDRPCLLAARLPPSKEQIEPLHVMRQGDFDLHLLSAGHTTMLRPSVVQNAMHECVILRVVAT